MGGEPNRGVSPVIGTVLLVAIVVLLAAAASVYLVSASDDQPEQAPQTAIVAEYSERTTANGEYLNLTIEGGDTLERNRLSLALSGARDSAGNPVELTGDPLGAQAPTTVGAGVEVSIHADQFAGVTGSEYLDLGEATLRLVWDPEPNSQSDTYVVYRWPEPSRR